MDHEEERHGASHECEGDCTGVACCVSVSALTDRPDLRLPDRVVSADLTGLRRGEPVSIPVPDRGDTVRVRALDSDPVSAVRRHVWTATFLS
jgi:hypothetical protein